MQPVDFTTLAAICADLRSHWLPARVEQVYQRDRFTLSIALRTFDHKGWLTLAWHPQAARLHVDAAPPRTPDTFTLSDQLRHQIKGLALIAITPVTAWERVVDLQFSQRPGDLPLWHLYLEVMGQYSNLILTTGAGQVITAAQQVSEQQSSQRSIQTGQPYQLPPRQTRPAPTPTIALAEWQAAVGLVPGPLDKMLLRTYRGLSSALVQDLARRAQLDPTRSTASLTPAEWACVYTQWQAWLQALTTEQFDPGWTPTGYTLLGGAPPQPVQEVVRLYYQGQLDRQVFQQRRHQITQRLTGLLKKATQKVTLFRDRLEAAAGADHYRQQADLLMAYLHDWQPGLTQITLPDFETGTPITIPLAPDKNAVQNAQALYKTHQKLRRSQTAVQPLLTAAEAELQYLEQVEAALSQIPTYQQPDDLWTLEEIRDELIQQGYLTDPEPRSRPADPRERHSFHRFPTPHGAEVWVGRNNRQNDELTFRIATDYDLWFHTQEIPGSHALLRLAPGAIAEPDDVQFAADLTAFFSRARHSEQAPVIYTQPRHVYKPKGAKPGMVIYKHEQVIWGRPQIGQQISTACE